MEKEQKKLFEEMAKETNMEFTVNIIIDAHRSYATKEEIVNSIYFLGLLFTAIGNEQNNITWEKWEIYDKAIHKAIKTLSNKLSLK